MNAPLGRLPPGWSTGSFGELLKEPLRNGHSAKATGDGSGVRTLSLSAVTYGDFSEKNIKLTSASPDKVRDLWLEPDDILIERSNTAELVGTARVFTGPSGFAIYPDLVIRARVSSHVLAPYVGRYLETPRVRHYFRTRAKGIAGSMPKIDQGTIEALPVLVAPPAEQDRIVAALDSYMSRLDAAAHGLRRVEANLKRYRASVLKAAVEGRLVPTEAELARREGRDFEPASVLLERILAERRRRWEDGQRAKMAAQGKSLKNDAWKARYEEPIAPNPSELPELPEGWCWASIDQLKQFSLYGPRFSSDDYSDDGVLVLRTSDISEWGRVDLSSPPRLRLSTADLERYRAQRGDLLITRTGSIGTLAVLDDAIDAVPGAYLIQYRLVVPEETTWFCFYTLKSPRGQTYLRRSGAGVGRPNLNAPTIDAFMIPLPPLAEHQRVIEEIRRLFSVSDEASKQVTVNIRRFGRLRQSILTCAFEGKLVDQDPCDEPASALLERIRFERELTPTRKRTRAPKRAKP